MRKFIHKSWLTPCISLSFLIVTVTGTLMLFHLKSGYLEHLHKMIGILFTLAGCGHVLLNWSAITSYLKKRKSIFSIVSVVLIAILCLFADDKDHHEKEFHHLEQHAEIQKDMNHND